MPPVQRISTPNMTLDPEPTSAGDGIHEALTEGSLEIVRMLPGASNATLFCRVTGPSGPLDCVFKPVAGERPLWDFPDATLTGREVAAFELARLMTWPLIPPTVWREDPEMGPGMCQLWIPEVEQSRPVDIFEPGQVPSGWMIVLEAHDGRGRPVVLAHDSSPALQAMAVFDAIVNNADRKGGHVLADPDGRIWGIDHGVCFAEEGKLRTVLWGWAGTPISEPLLRQIEGLSEALSTGVDVVDRWLDSGERRALRSRVRSLLDTQRLPLPGSGWPAVPWPVF